jgi:hypothetical protein
MERKFSELSYYSIYSRDMTCLKHFNDQAAGSKQGI